MPSLVDLFRNVALLSQKCDLYSRVNCVWLSFFVLAPATYTVENTVPVYFWANLFLLLLFGSTCTFLMNTKKHWGSDVDGIKVTDPKTYSATKTTVNFKRVLAAVKPWIPCFPSLLQSIFSSAWPNWSSDYSINIQSFWKGLVRNRIPDVYINVENCQITG